MEAKELRLGNLLKVKTSENDYNILKEICHKNILGHYFVFENINHGVWLDYDGRQLIEPIPLTEEWLFKFGFKKNQRDIRFKRLGSIVLKSTEKGFKFNYRESITYIHFVHQLQNLYFALNGVELTLKN